MDRDVPHGEIIVTVLTHYCDHGSNFDKSALTIAFVDINEKTYTLDSEETSRVS